MFRAVGVHEIKAGGALEHDAPTIGRPIGTVI